MYNSENGIMDDNVDVASLCAKRNEKPCDIPFSLMGYEILTYRLGNAVGYTGYAKAFLFLAQKLNIDTVGIVTISLESYTRLFTGLNQTIKQQKPIDDHVIVGIKLNDSTYHMIDPAIKKVTLFGQPPQTGALMKHILMPGIKQDPCLITAIMADLEQINFFKHIRNISVSGRIDDSFCRFD